MLAAASWGTLNGAGCKPDVWPMLADDLFRIAHDDYGKPRLHRGVASLGLGAAVLGELHLKQYVDIRDDLVRPIAAGDPIDLLAALVMRHLRAEPDELTVRDWLGFLASTAFPDGDIYGHVARRLERAHQIHIEPRRLLRRTARYVPTDINAAAWPWVRLSRHLDQHMPMNVFDTALGGLVLATDLHRRVLTGDAGAVETSLRRAIAGTTHPIRQLLTHTETAVGSTVITGA